MYILNKHFSFFCLSTVLAMDLALTKLNRHKTICLCRCSGQEWLDGEYVSILWQSVHVQYVNAQCRFHCVC